MTTVPHTAPGPSASRAFPAHDPVRNHLSSLRLNQLEALLAAADTACPSCNYNLRGQKGGICPECGRRLILVATRRRALLAAAAGCGLGVLLCALFLVARIMEVRTGQLTDRGIAGAFAAAPLFVFDGLGIALLLHYGRAFQAGSRTLKCWVIAAAWSGAIASLLLFLLFRSSVPA